MSMPGKSNTTSITPTAVDQMKAKMKSEVQGGPAKPEHANKNSKPKRNSCLCCGAEPAHHQACPVECFMFQV